MRPPLSFSIGKNNEPAGSQLIEQGIDDLFGGPGDFWAGYLCPQHGHEPDRFMLCREGVGEGYDDQDDRAAGQAGPEKGSGGRFLPDAS